ncbi:hypothetical protein SAMN05421805_106145 [Saccharopolyspora antimicrobica]|uniref:Uncharacterized protein n=1 Tax=Saccharopolyspora antimicrobica TaxID=455193 RepID=A0A1I5B7E0_9PSEU|nr:hypothetical protein [Saccharopolyspora antimicrobica]RKT86493.1 hypothetical protein ATL45_4870 [Saccharopolyspora antimicrobica]SFN70607.1 hypothetical protein SAMN05421805_106145 [Saccharopolyspora antimicrobica]
MHRAIARFAAAAGIAAAVLTGSYAISATQATTENRAAQTCGVGQNLNVLDVGFSLAPKLC